MTFNDLILHILVKQEIPHFDCGNTDLNDYFNNDSKRYNDELISKTYYWTHESDIVAMASISNDTINFEKMNRRKKKKKFNDCIQKHYPAVKIGRLGVNVTHQRKHIGEDIIIFFQGLFLVKNRTGCRFITIDAYNKPNVIKFYQKCGFKYFDNEDKDSDSRAMYLDLAPLYNRFDIQNSIENCKQIFELL